MIFLQKCGAKVLLFPDITSVLGCFSSKKHKFYLSDALFGQNVSAFEDFCVILCCHFEELAQKANKKQQKTYVTMKLYYGIICAILGAIILIISYLTGGVDYNWIQFLGILFVIAGIGVHIYVNYKKPQYDE
jgi:L-asparagine transporter-like permease